jgi:RimJ/RimL family protein N-acetyltransferase
LQLHAIDAAEGERIRSKSAGVDDVWADDYPFEGDVRAIGGFLRAWAVQGDQRPFGYYQISRRADGVTIGGIGFKGEPVDDSVEIGYGLAPSGRGQGYAAEAVGAVLGVAAEHGLTRVVADTDLDNVASQITLIRAGFALVRTDDQLHYFAAVLNSN